MAQVSYGTITITDTTDIERIYPVYCKGGEITAPTLEPLSNWSEVVSQAGGTGDYIWQRIVTKKQNINITINDYSDAVRLTGDDGAALTIVQIQYAQTQNENDTPSYGNSMPSSINEGWWLWVKTIYSDNSEVVIKTKQGQKGDQGYSVTNTRELYYLKTNSTAVPQITNSNQITNTDRQNGWTSIVPSYVTNGNYYTCIETTLDSPANNLKWSAPVINNALTDTNKKASDAYEATLARDTEINALKSQAKYYWWDSEGAHIASGLSSTDSDSNITHSTPNSFGYNALMAPGYLALRYQDKKFMQLSTNSLTFYKPKMQNSSFVQGNKAMELSSSGLVFYDGSAADGGNIQAQFGSSGAIQSGDYAINAATDKFSAYGTKIDLVHGEIYSPYFRLSQGTVSGGPVAGIYISGTFEATGALIGYQKTSSSDTNAYWKIGYMTDTNQDKLTYQRADNNGFIELAPSATFILQKNKIHTGWFGGNGYLTYPQLNSKYYDFGMNLPTSLTDKFLYVRYNTGSNLSTIYQNDSGWEYPFYIDGTGNINTTGSIDAHDIKIDGISIAGGSLVAGSLSSYGGSSNRPVYFPNSGENQGKPVQITITDNTSSTAVFSTDSNLITARTLYYAGYVKSSGITSVTVAATSPVVSSTNTAQTGSSASTTISLANAYGDTKNPYGAKTKNYVLAGPASGSAAAPTFRALVAADIPDLSETYLTSYTETDPIFTASAAYGITSSDIINWNGKTSNIGTVTKVSTGAGLAGGDITGAGTIKANLRSETKLTNDSTAATETSGRVYPIVLDKSGYLAVNVPWTNVNSNYLTSSSTLNWNNVTTNRPTTLNGYGITDAKIANGVVTLGSNTISKMPNPNALTIKVYNANTATAQGSTYSPTEVSYDGSASGKTASVAGTNAITNISAGAASGGTSTFTVVKADGSSSTFNVNISGAVVSGATILTDSNGNGLSVNGPVKFVNGVPETMRPTTTNNQFLRDDGTWATPTNTTYTFDGTYNASSNKAATVSTVTNAINALDGGTIGTPGTGKTITAISQTNGNISVTFGNISITKSQISDFPTELTPVSHTHGNIQDNGTLQTNDITIASGDKLVVTDSSNSDKIARASLVFTNSTTKFLREDGQFATPNYTTNTDSKVSSSNSSSKLFLVGTTSQSSSGQAGYSNSAVYATNGALVATTYNGLTLTKATTGFTIAGGTTSKTLTVNESYTLGAACAKGLSDSSSASAIGTGTNVTTERDIYYGLPTINNSHTYTSSTTIYAPTAGGTANTQALVGNGTTTAPKWVDISPSISITAGTASATPKINVTVLGQSGTTQSLTTASTSVYGATKLSSTSSSTEQGLAATPKLVYDSINSAVSNYVAKSGDTMTGSLTTPELITTKIKADDVNVTHLLTAEGIQTKNWTAVNMATIDGSFYIVPTVSIKAEGGAKLSYDSGTITLVAQGQNTFATNSLYITGNATSWTTGSLIMITGSVKINGEFVPIGTIKGTLTGVSTTRITFNSLTTDTGGTPNILSSLSSGHDCKDLKVSIYSYYNNSHENLLGIMMTTAGTKNRTYIDIYDGTHQTNAATDYYDSNTTYTEPVVRIGNLRGLPVMANGDAPTGWGIYTTNGYFKGIISAESGHIGKTSATKIVISDNASNAAIYSGSHSTLASTNTGFYIGTDGISIGSKFKYVGGSTNTLTVDSISATNFNFNTGSISGNVTIGSGGSTITNTLNTKASVDAEYSVEIITSNFNPAATGNNTLVTLTAKVTKVDGGSISGLKYQWFGNSTSLGTASTANTSYNVPASTPYSTFTVEIS